jgi:hypothetical protein
VLDVTRRRFRSGSTDALLVLAVVLVLGCQRTAEGPGALAVPPTMDASLFTRNQPPVRRVFEWDGQVVVESNDGLVGEFSRYFSLDVEKGVAAPITFPGAEAVLGFKGKGQALALCRGKADLFLLARQGEGWARQDLPEEIRVASDPPILCADADSVVLLGNQKAFWRKGAGWESVPFAKRPGSRPGDEMGWVLNHALLAKEKVYLGFDRGEWGGDLLALDLKTGAWEQPPLASGGGWPVRDLKLGPGETVWAVEGLAHLGVRHGKLNVFDGNEWKVFCCSSEGKMSNWNLDPASLDSVGFDGEGRVYVLSGCLGVARYEGGNWTQLTPGWPSFQYVSSLHITASGVAVIGMYDAGVLLVDLRSNQARRVIFPQ